MSALLIRNIKTLVQCSAQAPNICKGLQMNQLPTLNDAFLLIEDEKIKDFGPMQNCPEVNAEVLDASGRMVLPGWCDSHTHIVFAASRESEFVDRINGLSYVEIAAKGGGILNSARRLQNTSEEALLENAMGRLDELRQMGTGAVEIKSGYGLSVEAELKMLRVIQQLKKCSPITIKATFLGAHALPLAYKENREGYIDLIINSMLPRIADEGLADYIDVFCEKGFFSVAEMEQILEAGARFGLKPKVHTNQFNCMGGIQAALKYNAVSVDHLEVLNDEEIKALQHGETIATLLPSAPFFLNDHYPPATKLIDADVAVALATDYNPGSSPSGNMPFVLSLGCIKLRMTPNAVINAATINGAYAMEVSDQLGSITPGKKANLIITRPIPSIDYIPYAFGSDLIEQVLINGSRD